MSSFEPIPNEISFSWVYFPPLFFVLLFGVVAAWGVAKWLNYTKLSRYFWHPPVAYLALVCIFSSLFALFIMSP